LSTIGKLFEEVILKIIQWYVEERGLLNASQFDSRARHSSTLQCMRFTEHVTLKVNNNMSTAELLVNVEKPLSENVAPWIGIYNI
jgi:hypothetical protein